jgi:hypothetical protein
MKKLVLLFLIAGCCIPRICISQTFSYTYEYDASGNRISRTAIQLRSAKIPKDSLSSESTKTRESEVFKDVLDNREIKIYPNPTRGLLTVDIPLRDNDLARISLYDIQGRTLMDIKSAGTSTEVDLSGQPAGVYLIRIFVNNKPLTWKIIKQD